MMFVTAIPVVGLLMILVWAFTGENESRKNYFRAILSWILIFVVLGVALVFVVGWLGGEPAFRSIFRTTVCPTTNEHRLAPLIGACSRSLGVLPVAPKPSAQADASWRLKISAARR